MAVINLTNSLTNNHTNRRINRTKFNTKPRRDTPRMAQRSLMRY